MSHGNDSSAFVFQVMGILKPVTVSTDKGLQLSHSPMVGCHLLGSARPLSQFIINISKCGIHEGHREKPSYLFLCGQDSLSGISEGPV